MKSRVVFEFIALQNPRGVLPNKEVGGGGGGLDLTSGLEAKFGARSGQVHKIRGKIWEVLSPKDAKLGKSPNFLVISEIQRAKFGVFVIYILEAEFGAPTRISEVKFGPSPPDLLIWKYPPGCRTLAY